MSYVVLLQEEKKELEERVKELEDCLARIITRCHNYASVDTKGIMLSTLQDAEQTLGPPLLLPATTTAEGQQGEAQCTCAGHPIGRLDMNGWLPFNPLCPVHADQRDTSMDR